MSDGNGTQDSWDQNPNLTSELSKKISTLNVNAAEFIPNFNPFGSKQEKSSETEGNYYYIKFSYIFIFTCGIELFIGTLLTFVMVHV